MAFVASLVVAGEAGHEVLRVACCHVVEKVGGALPPEGGDRASAMTDHDLVATHLVLESLWAWHVLTVRPSTRPASEMLRALRCLCLCRNGSTRSSR